MIGLFSCLLPRWGLGYRKTRKTNRINMYQSYNTLNVVVSCSHFGSSSSLVPNVITYSVLLHVLVRLRREWCMAALPWNERPLHAMRRRCASSVWCGIRPSPWRVTRRRSQGTHVHHWACRPSRPTGRRAFGPTVGADGRAGGTGKLRKTPENSGKL